MLSRILISILVPALLAGGVALAQTKVKTETIRPPGAQKKFENDGHVVAPAGKGLPEIISDLSRLPPAVTKTRERILAAAYTGDLQQVVDIMKENAAIPIFSFSEDQDPIAFWKASFPDSDGVEALSILINLLEVAFVHVDVGTPQEIYLWPYFARLPLKVLTLPQRVELFRIVTGVDYKEMVEFGAYSFYRVGIAPDGSWQFFVSGD